MSRILSHILIEWRRLANELVLDDNVDNGNGNDIVAPEEGQADKFCCEICKKVFSKNSNFRSYIWIHNKSKTEARLRVWFCGQTFALKGPNRKPKGLRTRTNNDNQEKATNVLT